MKKEMKEMQDKELENVAGGFCMKDGKKVISGPSDFCNNWTCKNCDGKEIVFLPRRSHECSVKGDTITIDDFACSKCKYSKNVDGYGRVCDYENMTNGSTTNGSTT